MRRIISIFILLTLAGAVFAEGNGGFAGSYLRIGLGARGISMGNAQVASPDNGLGFFYNPAGLPFLNQRQVNLSYSFLSLDRRFNYIGFATPIKPHAGIALGWIYSGVKDISAYNSSGVRTGEISHGLHAFYFSFGLQFLENRLSIGLSAKYLLEKLSGPNGSFDYSGNGFGGDVGVYFRAFSWLSLGYQIKDINGKLESNSDKIFERGMTVVNRFPLSNRVGFYALSPWQWLRMAYDFEWSNKGETAHHVGLEARVPMAALRVGYDKDHFTFGGGVEIKTGFGIHALLDYGFSSSVIDEGASHVFTWTFLF